MPAGVHISPQGFILIADTENHAIREVDPASGLIATLAGTGSAGFSGDGGFAAAAQLRKPNSVRSDADGNILIADTDNNVIRRIAGKTSKISTIAGIAGSAGYNGDDILATAAKLRKPRDLWLTPDGTIYIADTDNHRIRRIDVQTGVISTVAGNGSAGYKGDGGPAVEAELDKPEGVSADTAGNIYIADTGNECIRRVDVDTGIIRRVAGTDGEGGFDGDGDKPRSAKVSVPKGIWVDQSTSSEGGVVRP
jgi:sugar lactone lactonase YvrE